jgi:hypothetical protein
MRLLSTNISTYCLENFTKITYEIFVIAYFHKFFKIVFENKLNFTLFFFTENYLYINTCNYQHLINLFIETHNFVVYSRKMSTTLFDEI